MTGEAPPSTDRPCPSPLQARQEIPSGEMIWLTLNLLFSLGQVVELRSWDKRGKIRSGYYNDMEALTKAAEALDLPETEGVYITLNEIKPELLYRRSNRIDFVKTGESTSDQDVIHRLWLPIDTDPERPVAKISSTNEEHEKAIEKAYSLKGILVSLGFPAPIIADSGNGGHVLVKIDLPNTTENSLLIADCLQALQDIAGDEKIKIDQTSKNPARVWKLYGTVARKGDNLPERPHRRARLLEVPEKIEAASRELLEQLAALKTKTPPSPTAKKPFTKSIDLAEWLSANSSRLPPYTSVSKPGWRHFYKFESCPFNSAHTTGAFVGQLHNGALVAKCHHNSCGALTQRWDDLRKIGEPAQEKKIKAPDSIEQPAEEDRSDRATLIRCSNFMHTDLGNQERFIFRYGDVVRYCYPLSSWFVWNGVIWERDNRGAVYSLAADTVRKIHLEADFLQDDKRKDIFKWSLLSEGERSIRNMLKLSEHKVSITPQELNRDPLLLTVKNRTIELNSFTVREHRQQDLISQCANVDYVSEAKAPTWETHIRTVFNGNEAIIRTFQEICGSCLSGANPDMLFIIAYGTGKNGKSVTLAVLSDILSNYSRNLDPSSLMVKKYESGGDAARPDIIRLLGGRFITSIETRRGRRLAENWIKLLTGGDKITARDLYGKMQEFVFGGKIFLASNNKPKLRELSIAIRERIVLIPFLHFFAPEERDPDIINKLLAERSGILNWCIEGWKRTRERMPYPRIEICQEVRAATEEYLKENDDIAPFLEWEETYIDNKTNKEVKKKVFVLDPQGCIAASHIWGEYTTWCAAQNPQVKPMTRQDFADALRDHRIMDKHTKKGNFWCGIRSAKEEKQVTIDEEGEG